MSLSYQGDDNNGQHVLKINNESTDYFPQYLWREPNYDIVRTSVISEMKGGKVAQMTFPLWIRKIPVNLIVHHNRVTRFTRVTCTQKYYMVVKQKKLMDRSLWPI